MTATPADSAPSITPPAPPRPRTLAPELTVDLVGGSRWSLSELPLGYNLSLETMREWGLFVSTAANDNEPDVFTEPATFLVDGEHRIYYASLTSMPFGRPQLAELLGGIDFVTSSNYPARGDS